MRKTQHNDMLQSTHIADRTADMWYAETRLVRENGQYIADYILIQSFRVLSVSRVPMHTERSSNIHASACSRSAQTSP